MLELRFPSPQHCNLKATVVQKATLDITKTKAAVHAGRAPFGQLGFDCAGGRTQDRRDALRRPTRETGGSAS